MRRIIIYLSVVIGLASASGCRGVLTLCERVYPPRYPDVQWDTCSAPVTERGELAFDDSAVTSLKQIDAILSPMAAPPGYSPMSPQTVQCLAAGAASTPALIDEEMDLLCYLASVSKDRRTRVLWIQKDLSELRAADLRNNAAANALTIYYNIAAAEKQRGLLRQSLVQIDEAKKIIEQYRLTGRPIPSDATEFDRQEIEIREKKAQLAVTLEQLNGKLRLLLAAPPGPAPHIWPEDDFTVRPEYIDVDAAIQLGLRQRADLASLRIIHDVLDQDTLPLARAVLRQQDGVLGVPATQHPLFHKNRVARELGVRDRQLALLYTVAENAAVDEINQKAMDLAQSLRNVATSKEKLISHQKRLIDVEKKILVGRSGRLEVPLVQLEIIRAKGDLIQKTIDWKIALVQLNQSQGVLSAECGYPRCFVWRYNLGR